MSSEATNRTLWVIAQCQRVLPDPALLTEQDGLLFRGDGVYLLTQPSWRQYRRVMALAEDCKVRNIPLPETVLGIDYQQWVEQTLHVTRIINW